MHDGGRKLTSAPARRPPQALHRCRHAMATRRRFAPLLLVLLLLAARGADAADPARRHLLVQPCTAFPSFFANTRATAQLSCAVDTLVSPATGQSFTLAWALLAASLQQEVLLLGLQLEAWATWGAGGLWPAAWRGGQRGACTWPPGLLTSQ